MEHKTAMQRVPALRRKTKLEGPGETVGVSLRVGRERQARR
jgi:hypothetical protein